MRLGVYFGWHVHPFETLLALVREAEALGYAAAFVDGDVSMLARRSEADCLDGWTLLVALLARTERIPIGSLRLVHHWNAARLAQAAASAERLFPGRLRFQISIGDWPIDARFGFPLPSPGERVAWLGETVDALRALWSGQSVTRAGRFVRLSEARVRPTPPGGRLPIAVAARRPRMLELVAEHADVWDVNLPAIPERVEAAARRLGEACARRGRDPASIARSMLLFARAGASLDAARHEFRERNPWFAAFGDAEIEPGLVVGEASACRARLAELAERLGLALPVLDLSGLAADAARRQLEACSAGG